MWEGISETILRTMALVLALIAIPALAYRRYSLDYVEDEAAAQAARRGIWAGEFVKPWEWRRGKRLQAGD